MADLLIADDHPIFLSGLRSFLEAHGHRIIAQNGTVDEVIKTLAAVRPDIIMIDCQMPDGGGLQILEHLRRTGINIPSILLTVGIEGADISAALGLGVNGMVLKNNEPQSVIECIAAVMRGEDWYDDAMIKVLIAHQQNPRSTAPATAQLLSQLSSREREIAEYVANGARNREIAERFAIAEGTVKVHLHRIYRKLGIGSRGELMLLVVRRP